MYFPVSPTSSSGPTMPRTMREFIRAASASPTKQPRSHSPSRRDSLAASFASSLSPCTSPRAAQLQESPRRIFLTTSHTNTNTTTPQKALTDVNMSVEDRRTFSDEANSLLCPRPTSAGTRRPPHFPLRPQCHVSEGQTDYEDNYAGASSSSCVSSQRVLTTEGRTRRERSLQRESDRCSGVSASLRVTNATTNNNTTATAMDENSRGSTPCLSVSDTRAGPMARSGSFIAVAHNASSGYGEEKDVSLVNTPASHEDNAFNTVTAMTGSTAQSTCTPVQERLLSTMPRTQSPTTTAAVPMNNTAMQPILGLTRFIASPQSLREQLGQDTAQLASSYRSNSPARLSASSSSFSSLFTNDLMNATANNSASNNYYYNTNYGASGGGGAPTPLTWRPQVGPAFPLPRAPPRLSGTGLNTSSANNTFTTTSGSTNTVINTQSARTMPTGASTVMASPSPRPPHVECEYDSMSPVAPQEDTNEVLQGMKEGDKKRIECPMAMPWAPQLATSATHSTSITAMTIKDGKKVQNESEWDMAQSRRFHDAMTMEHIEHLIARGRPRVENTSLARPMVGTLAQAIQATLPEPSSFTDTSTSSFTMYTSETGGSTRRAVSPSRARASPSPPRSPLDSSEGHSMQESNTVSETQEATPLLSSNPVVVVNYTGGPTASASAIKGVPRATGTLVPPRLVKATSGLEQHEAKQNTPTTAAAGVVNEAASTIRLADRVAAEEETLPPPSSGPIVPLSSTSALGQPKLRCRQPPVLATASGRRTIRFIEPHIDPRSASTEQPQRLTGVYGNDANTCDTHLTPSACTEGQTTGISNNAAAALLNAPQEEGGRLSDLSVYEPLDEEPQIDEVHYLRAEIENADADAEALAEARRREYAQRLCATSQQARDAMARDIVATARTTTNTTTPMTSHTPSHDSWQSSSKATTEFEEVDAETIRSGWMTLRDSSPPVRDRSMAPHELIEERRRHISNATTSLPTHPQDI